jgi:hypothetical protein
MLACACSARGDELPLIRSARGGPWSAAATWEGGKVPGPGDRVQVREGHTVVYDAKTEKPIRLIHIAGTLRFATDRDTRLDVGLIRIQAGDDASENGFDCEAHVEAPDPGKPRPALEVGGPNRPIDPRFTALIRLHYIRGMDEKSCPAIVCCGGRMDFHGAPLSRTWVKLGATARKGEASVTLAEPVTGWKAGDRVIVTATQSSRDSGINRRPGPDADDAGTEQRIIKAIDGTRITLDRPLSQDHAGTGDFRGAVAILSRNVVVESADPNGIRGHTMYHKNSAGAVSYAEFRHLGKENTLGRYALHFHLCGDTMRGSYVLGTSVWDSHNRWLTIHGTNYLVVRDCVGYQSVGHGYFLEDGTEVYNVLDRNLAVQAYRGKPLKNQALPFDHNDGAGFWWANSLNSFTRNVACENDRYGYRFEATPDSRIKLTMPVQQPDGARKAVDIRTLPFIRFDDNECHCDGLYGFNLGEGVGRVGPDAKHPFVIRNMKIWQVHYAFRPQAPSVLVEDMTIHQAVYGVYHPNFDRHVYRRMVIRETIAEPFNRGHDDVNQQFGPLAVDGLTLEKCSGTLIQVSQYAPKGGAESHFRNVVFKDNRKGSPWLNTTPNGQPRNPPPDDVIPYYFHDWFGPGRHAKLLTASATVKAGDGLEYRAQAEPIKGDKMRFAEVKNVKFPELLHPVDDLSPSTVITHVRREGGKVIVRGTTADNGTVARVVVNGRAARSLTPNYLEWEAALDAPPNDILRLEAHGEDAAGNREPRPHRVSVSPQRQ